MREAIVGALLAVALAGCGDSSKSSSGNPVTAPVDYIGAVGKAKSRSEKVVDVATLQKAIQAFHADEDRYPKDLNELVTSKILPTLPEPPDGMKFQYNPQTGAIKAVAAQ